MLSQAGEPGAEHFASGFFVASGLGWIVLLY
jgi:hypothetical protein